MIVNASLRARTCSNGSTTSSELNRTAGEPPVPKSPSFSPSVTFPTETGLRAAIHPLYREAVASLCLCQGCDTFSMPAPQPASSRLAADLRPSSCSARSILEPSRHRLRHRQNPCPFLYLCTYLIVVIYIIIYTCCMTYLYLHPCLCRAFVPVYLSIFLSLVLWMYVLLRVVVLIVFLFSHWLSHGSCSLCFCSCRHLWTVPSSWLRE